MKKIMFMVKNVVVGKIFPFSAMMLLMLVFVGACSQNLSAQSTFSVEKLAAAIEKYVTTSNGCKSVVTIDQTLKSHRFPQSGIKAEIEHKGNLSGLCKVTLVFSNNGDVVGREVLRLKVRLYAEVPVATKFIPKGQEILCGDIVMKEAEVTNINPYTLVDTAAIVGVISKSGIAKGSVVTYLMISPKSSAISIEKNAQINCLLYSGAICIKMNCRALDAGSVGDVIRVNNKDGKTFYGFIADDGNVIIEDKSLFSKK